MMLRHHEDCDHEAVFCFLWPIQNIQVIPLPGRNIQTAAQIELAIKKKKCFKTLQPYLADSV
jgi:hypothetical protein